MDMSLTLTKTIATFFGAGLLPKAPGTFATLATLPLYLLLRRLTLAPYLLIVILLTAIGIAVSGEMEQEWGRDPSRVVIDEVCGLLVTLVSRPAGFREIALGTILFRIFDILKPPPISSINRDCSGGAGVMADDLAAGLISACILHFISRKRS
jgi:phosphatidylglycerophosphatase A